MKLLIALNLLLFLVPFAHAQSAAAPQANKQQNAGQESKIERDAGKEESGEQGRVRAKDPTVVTVEGRSERVEEDRGGAGSKLGRGIRSAAGGTVRALGRFGGWLLNIGEDIPSDRERRDKTTDDQRGQSR